MIVSNINSRIHAGGHACPRKVCDEIKERKNNGHAKFFCRQEGLCMAVAEVRCDRCR